MLRPKVVMHNSVSLDGSVMGFEVNMGLHYSLAGEFGADIHLTGSNTVRVGAEMFGGVPPEEASDLKRPDRGPEVPFWAVVDSRGALKGMLHTMRRFELCRDVIVFVSKKTPKAYVRHLEQREYRYHVAGSDRVDLAKMLEILKNEYKSKVVFSDSGPTLNGLLLQQGLLDEVSLLVHPCLVGKDAVPIFGNLGNTSIELKLKKCERLKKKYLHLVYEVVRSK